MIPVQFHPVSPWIHCGGMEWPFRKEQDVGALIKNMFLDIHQYFLKNGPIPASFSFIFVFSTLHNYKFYKSLDGVLGTRTQGGRMEEADESTVLWRHPNFEIFLSFVFFLSC